MYVTPAKCPDGVFYGAAWRADDSCIGISPEMKTRAAARKWALDRLKEEQEKAS